MLFHAVAGPLLGWHRGKRVKSEKRTVNSVQHTKYSVLSNQYSVNKSLITDYWVLATGYWVLLLLLMGITACSGGGESATPEPPATHFLFTDVTNKMGLDFQHGAFRWGLSGDPAAMMGGGLCWLDYDNNGRLDLFAVNSYAEAEAGRWQTEQGGLPHSSLFQNIGVRFEDVTRAAGLDVPMRGNGCVAADLNMDGWMDIYVTTARFSMLFWNNGNGTFSEGAEAAGVDAYGWHTAAVVGDLNKDGWPDLFVAGYVDINNRIPGATLGFPNSHFGLRDLLYISQGVDSLGRVTFREVGEVAGLETADFEYGLGALFSDVDNDKDLDLYVANDTNPNRLYLNDPWPGGIGTDPQGIGFRLREVGGDVQVDDDHSGMGVASGDYNQDGRFDLFITNMGQQPNSLYPNQTISPLLFGDAAAELNSLDLDTASTGWGTTWADFDLDTDLDLLVVNGSIPVMDLIADRQLTQLFTNLTAQGQPGLYQNQTEAAGFMAVGPLLGRGGAAADFDNDGDLDIAISTIGGSLVLLQNNAPPGNWVLVKPDGFYPGTVVTAVLPNGTVLRRELHAGSSYLSSEDTRIHLGLGTADHIVELTLYWPNGTQIHAQNVQANQFVVLRP